MEVSIIVDHDLLGILRQLGPREKLLVSTVMILTQG